MESTSDAIFISQRVTENKELVENNHLLLGLTIEQIHNAGMVNMIDNSKERMVIL